MAFLALLFKGEVAVAVLDVPDSYIWFIICHTWSPVSTLNPLTLSL
jgi:hypothetical protein